MADYITKIITAQGTKQIDYNALANKPTAKDLIISNDLAQTYSLPADSTVEDALNTITRIDCTLTNCSLSAQSWSSIAYGNNTFVAVDSATTGIIAVRASLDTYWTEIEIEYNAQWNDIIFDGTRFIVVGSAPDVLDGTTTAESSSYSVLMYSEDGYTWVPQDGIKTLGATWNSIVYGNGKYIAFDITGSIAAESTDLINWSGIVMPDIVRDTLLYSAYGNGVYLAVGNWYLARSTDGTNWETINAMINNCSAIIYGQNTFIAVCDDGTIYRRFMDNGWYIYGNIGNHNWKAVTYDGEDKFVALSEDGHIAISEDTGLTWTIKNLGTTNAFMDITFGNGEWIIIGKNSLDSSYIIDFTRTARFATENALQNYATKYDIMSNKYNAFLWPDNIIATIDDYHWNVPLEGNTSLYPFIPFSNTVDELPSMVYLKLTSDTNTFGKLRLGSIEPSVDMFIWYNKATDNFDAYMIGKHSTATSSSTEETYESFAGYKSNLNKRGAFNITAQSGSDIWTGDFGWLMNGIANDAMMRVNIEFIYYDTTGIHMTWRNQYDGHQYTNMKCTGCVFK